MVFKPASLEDMINKGKPYIFNLQDRRIELRVKPYKTIPGNYYIEEKIWKGQHYRGACEYHTNAIKYQFTLLKDKYMEQYLNRTTESEEDFL